MSEGLIAFAVAIAFVLMMLSYWFGWERGRDDLREEIEKESEQAEKDRDRIEGEIAGRPDDQLDKDLGPWHRD
jgi:hypothetical protein